MRRTNPPEHLDVLAGKLSRFTYAVIDQTCERIEDTPRAKGEAAFPDSGTLIEECRLTSMRTRNLGNHWTVERYRECRTFDRWMKDQTTDRKKPKTREQVLAEHPEMAVMWTAWNNQRERGTLSCPGWCDACEGSRVVVLYEDGTKPWSNGPYGLKHPANNAAENERHRTMNTHVEPCPACQGR